MNFLNKVRFIDFDLGVANVTDKIWFDRLNTCGEFLNDEHLNVCLYYLRKKIKYSGNVDQRVTKTDCLFYQTCKETNKRCPVSDYFKVAAIRTMITKYILGTYMCCATPWAYADHVAMHVFVEVDAHFVLAHFDIKQRSLVVYNSLPGAAHRATALEVVEPLAVLIFVYLENTSFYDSKDNLDFTQGPYSLPRSSPLEVVVVDNVPVQDDCDCGIFTILFVDHIIHDIIHNFKGKLNISNYRDAMKKKLDGYTTPSERLVRMRKKTKTWQIVYNSKI